MKKSKRYITEQEVIDSANCNFAKLREVEDRILNLVYANAFNGEDFKELRDKAIVLKKSISKQTQMLQEQVGTILNFK
jgi:hypothetical protein